MTQEIGLTLAVLLVTVLLLATEVLRADAVALLVMLALPWLGLISPGEAFAGLSSNAVLAMAGVMILGYGVDRSGLTRGLTDPVVRWAGDSERRLLLAVMGTVGVMSAFMQNIGAAALFLPVVVRIARKGGFPASRLLMPMGFAAILGGTVSMIGSGPLILLDDLVRRSDLEGFGLFASTPYGLCLLIAGVAFFAVFGARVLPARKAEDDAVRSQRELIESWDLVTTVHELVVPASSSIVGRTREELELRDRFDLHLVALAEDGDIQSAPWRHTRFAAGQKLAVLGSDDDVRRFAAGYGLEVSRGAIVFRELQGADSAGFAEVLVSPRAPIVGRSIRQFALRKNHEVEPIVLLSGGEARTRDFSDVPLRAGDTLLVYGTYDRVRAMGDDPSFVVLTRLDIAEVDASKRVPAGLCFAGALALALLGFPLALALLSGAFCMVLLGVVRIDAAYRAVDWRTIVLIGGLIPLGTAMEKSGAARWLAEAAVGLVADAHALVVLAAVGVLATGFSLFMSNVAATIVLVPLVVTLGPPLDLDPRMLALLVGICASNSFVLPTHQVNALLMTPGGYRNADYLRAGGAMTVLFLAMAVGGMYLLFPLLSA